MFEKNDYLEIVDHVYSPAMNGNGAAADLSGWEYSPLALLPPRVCAPPRIEDLSRYYVDSGTRLNAIKERLVPALEVLETCRISCDNFILLPSTTSGIGIVLAYLKEEGVERVIVEAPSYYAVVDVATRLGMACEFMAPQELEHGRFATDVERLLGLMERRGTCLWLHQPRYALGCDLRLEDLCTLADRARDCRFLVLDEANDDTVPSLTAGLHMKANVFRLRGVTKTLGLNGIRLSLLFHPNLARDKLVEIMWSVGAPLDWYSISMVESLFNPRLLYADLLRQMRSRLLPQRRLTAAYLRGAAAQLLPSTTGFLGSIRLDWRSLVGTEDEKRQRLIGHMARCRIPVMLGAHTYMPKQIGFEHIRVNFLNNPDTLGIGVAAIHSFFSSPSLS